MSINIKSIKSHKIDTDWFVIYSLEPQCKNIIYFVITWLILSVRPFRREFFFDRKFKSAFID